MDFLSAETSIKVAIKSGQLAKLILNPENEFLLEGAREELGFCPCLCLRSLIPRTAPELCCAFSWCPDQREQWFPWAFLEPECGLSSEESVQSSLLLPTRAFSLPPPPPPAPALGAAIQAGSRQDLPYLCCCPESALSSQPSPRGLFFIYIFGSHLII